MMRKVMRLGATSLCVIVICTALVACGGSGDARTIPKNAVAAVGDVPVTKAEVMRWMQIEAAKQKTVVPEPPRFTRCVDHAAARAKTRKSSRAQLHAACAAQYEELKKTALARIIYYDWLRGEAKELKSAPTRRQLETRFETVEKTQFGGPQAFRAFLRRSGNTVATVMQGIEVSGFLAPRIEAHARAVVQTPTATEVRKFYEAHVSAYRQPERRNLRIVKTNSASRAARAEAELRKGKLFAYVAKKFSVEKQSRAHGGVLDGLERDPHEPKLSALVFSAKPNRLVGPVKARYGYYLFEVTRVEPVRQQSLRAVEAQIEKAIMAPRELAAAKRFGARFRRKWRQRTLCRPGYVVELCRGFHGASATKRTSTATESAGGSSSSASVGQARTSPAR
ncbi:MAG: peptidylprolyl isomerase [Solirubrobacteraceae bacterium]